MLAASKPERLLVGNNAPKASSRNANQLSRMSEVEEHPAGIISHVDAVVRVLNRHTAAEVVSLTVPLIELPATMSVWDALRKLNEHNLSGALVYETILSTDTSAVGAALL